MSQLHWIAGLLLAAGCVLLLPLASAATLVDDTFAVEENGIASIPVLRNDIAASTLPSMAFDGSARSSDASGPYLLTYGGVNFYAFRNTDDGRGTGTAISGWSSLAGIAPSRLTYTSGDLELVGVSGTSSVAYEVYAELDGSVQPQRFLVDGVVVGEGTLDVANVVIDRNSASPTFGLATGYGQARLTGPAAAPFYQEVVSASCGSGVLFFELGRFVPTTYSDPDIMLIQPRVVPVAFPVVSVTQAGHGLVTIDAGGATVTYTPVHGYDGVDHFTYTVRSCDGVEQTATVTVAVTGVNDAPVAAFTGPTNADTSASIMFHDTSYDVDGTITSRSWTFGDGTTSTSADPMHAWPDDGTFNVCLSVVDNDGAASAQLCRPIVVGNRPPTTSFSGPAELVSLTSGAFVDTSVDIDGTIVAWAWTFGDGTTSTSADPEHAWSAPGSYEVCLSVADNDGATPAAACHEISVLNRAPLAAFGSSAPAFTGTAVLFTDLSFDLDGAIASWSWTFGDGDSAFLASPTHAYADDGEYNVCLDVADDLGALDSVCTTVLIHNRPPVARAAFGPGSPRTTDVVAFQDQSTDIDGEIVSWAWDFGDGNASTEQMPSHGFRLGGTYIVTLVVTDDDGATDSVSLQVVVTPLYAQGRATGASLIGLTNASALGATGSLRTQESLALEVADIEHDLGVLRFTGARGRVDLAPGVARAVAQSAHARVALPAGHVIELFGATASVDATCSEQAASWSVAEVRLDGTPISPDALAGALALLPGAPTVQFGATSSSAEGVQIRAVTIALDGAELVLSEASAGFDGCPAALRGGTPDGAPWPLLGASRGGAGSLASSTSLPSPCPQPGCGARRAPTVTRR